MTADDKRNELYAQTRDDLLKRQLSNNENFDRAILTLSSAGLATSVAFLRGMAAEYGTWWLVLSWVAFVGAIIATLVSFQTSQAGIKRQLELAEDYYLKKNDDALTASNKAAEWTDRLAGWSAISFICGIILLLCFFGSNLHQNTPEADMTKEIPGSQKKGASVNRMQQIEGGATVPNMQQAPTDDLGSSIPPMQQLPEQRTDAPSGGTTNTDSSTQSSD
ncbi:hypothetical protein Enr13x_18840 [Stieleria neptunia]|uniref:Uncharacterized protein n=1 Tax=Stieleria neptunia TaxID=2527979 RepID=A0A518HMG1_9BACT|nr:hypothetical protein [Stieleria neptunia]QDV42041.1 hypothetical protein Enr13x_18840 [Stieleria neptunia]